jgi:hypothetical protein
MPMDGLGFIAAWFVFGQARIVLTSKLAEHRIDRPDPGKAMEVSWAAGSARRNAANYDPRGRRLLPWYLVVNFTYWTLVAGACWWVVRHA